MSIHNTSWISMQAASIYEHGLRSKNEMHRSLHALCSAEFQFQFQGLSILWLKSACIQLEPSVFKTNDEKSSNPTHCHVLTKIQNSSNCWPTRQKHMIYESIHKKWWPLINPQPFHTSTPSPAHMRTSWHSSPTSHWSARYQLMDWITETKDKMLFQIITIIVRWWRSNGSTFVIGTVFTQP